MGFGLCCLCGKETGGKEYLRTGLCPVCVKKPIASEEGFYSALDRIAHNAYQIIMEGESYRNRFRRPRG